MKDKERIILVVYVGISHISDADSLEFLRKIQERTESLFDDSVKFIVVPRSDTNETWIECVNPQIVTEDKYKEAEDAVDRLKKILEEKDDS